MIHFPQCSSVNISKAESFKNYSITSREAFKLSFKWTVFTSYLNSEARLDAGAVLSNYDNVDLTWALLGLISCVWVLWGVVMKRTMSLVECLLTRRLETPCKLQMVPHNPKYITWFQFHPDQIIISIPQGHTIYLLAAVRCEL